MGTAIVVAVIIVVVLVFIWLATTVITRRVEHAQGRDTCCFCGAALVPAGIEYAPDCPACGRRQPWDTDPVDGAG